MNTILLSWLTATIWTFLFLFVIILGVFLAGLTYELRKRKRAKRKQVPPRFNHGIHGEFCKN